MHTRILSTMQQHSLTTRIKIKHNEFRIESGIELNERTIKKIYTHTESNDESK